MELRTPHPASGHPLPSSDEGRGKGEGSRAVSGHFLGPESRNVKMQFPVSISNPSAICPRNSLATWRLLPLLPKRRRGLGGGGLLYPCRMPLSPTLSPLCREREGIG